MTKHTPGPQPDGIRGDLYALAHYSEQEAATLLNRAADLLGERDRLNAELLTALVSLLDALDTGDLEMNSPEIGGENEDNPPHRWHEEWVHYARAATAKAKGEWTWPPTNSTP